MYQSLMTENSARKLTMMQKEKYSTLVSLFQTIYYAVLNKSKRIWDKRAYPGPYQGLHSSCYI